MKLTFERRLSVVERWILKGVIESLSKSEHAPEALKAALEDVEVRSWLDTYVTSPLKVIINPDRTRADLENARLMAEAGGPPSSWPSAGAEAWAKQQSSTTR